MSISKDSLDKYLGDYLELGYAIHEFELKPFKVKVKIKTITVEEQRKLESEMKNVPTEEVAIYKMHAYQISYLSTVLLAFGDKIFKTPDEAKTFLLSKGTAISDKIMAEQAELEKLFREDLKEGDIENFSKPLSTGTEQN